MKTSLDFEDTLFLAFRQHCKAVGMTMTAGLETAMREVLRAAGKLPDDEISIEIARTRELIETRGIAVVRAKHDELADGVAEIEPALAGGGK